LSPKGVQWRHLENQLADKAPGEWIVLPGREEAPKFFPFKEDVEPCLAKVISAKREGRYHDLRNKFAFINNST
jgi:hypothetical protein